MTEKQEITSLQRMEIIEEFKKANKKKVTISVDPREEQEEAEYEDEDESTYELDDEDRVRFTAIGVELSDGEKSRTLFACLLALTIGNMMINNVVSFLPTFIESNTWVSWDNYQLNQNDTAIILAMFSIAQIIFAPVNGMIKNSLGSKNTIVVGFILLTVTTAGLGGLAYCKNPYVFKYTACVLRFF